MPNYQVAPYRITAKIRRGDEADVLLVESVTSEGQSARDIIAWTLREAEASGPFSSVADRDLQFGVSNVLSTDNAVTFVVDRGTTGIRSKLQKGEESYDRDEEHREHIEFRCMLVFPKRGHHVILMVERIGNVGVATFVRKLLMDTLRELVSEISLTIDPVTTAADMRSLQVAVKELTFHLPSPGDVNGRREGLTGSTGRFDVKYKERNLKLDRFTDADGGALDANKVYGVLRDGLGFFGSDVNAGRAQELGVSADLTVQLPGGARRTFTLGTDEGPALVYPIESADQERALYTLRPEESDFVSACQGVVGSFVGRYDVNDSTPALCVIPDGDAAPKTPEHWKAVWNVADLDTSTS